MIDTGYVTITDSVGNPGQFVDGSDVPFPDLNQLRRVRCIKHHDRYQIISFMLTNYSNTCQNNYGLLCNSYCHPEYEDNKENSYKMISKQWRINKAIRHPDVSAFTSLVFNDADKDLTNVCKSINNLIIN